MKEFLIRLKLIEHLTSRLDISKISFVNRLSEITDRGDTGLLSDTFDVFSSSKNEFKGEVTFENFKIKRRRKFFNTNMSYAVANGTFLEHEGKLIVETEISGLTNYLIFFYGFLIVIYSIFILSFLLTGNKEGFFALPFILLHAAFMFLVPYFLIRRSVKRLKYDLEREFFYLTKNG
jgi:pilus assembly protein TadC